MTNGDIGANFSLNTIVSYAGHFAWKHHWTDTIRTNVNISRSQMEVANATSGGKAVVAPGTLHIMKSAHANVIWSPVKQVNIGLEYQFAKGSLYNGNNTIPMNRIQIGFQYRF